MRAIRILGAPLILVLAAIACNTPGSAELPTIVVTGAPLTEAANVPTATSAANPASGLTSPPTSQAAASPATGGGPATAIPPTTAPAKGPQRISFAPGGTGANASGSFGAGGSASYVINVGAGQRMSIVVANDVGPLTLTVTSPAGSVVTPDSSAGADWSAVLPQKGDYLITVTEKNGGAASFGLRISIPPLAASSGGSNVQCWVTTAGALQAMRESSPTADVFGTAAAGEKTLALARTKDGWLGFDPGVAQAGNQGRARLRWYYTQGASLTFDPAGCDQSLPVVLSLQSLQNGTYHVIGLQDVTLTDGEYAFPNFDPAKTGSMVADSRMTQVMAFGDLNGDGSEDALIVLGTNTGGTGTFVEIMPVLNVNGSGQPGGSIQVGDRSPVNSLSIDAGVITAEVTVDGPNDGACCPSLHQTWAIKLVNGKLVKQ